MLELFTDICTAHISVPDSRMAVTPPAPHTCPYWIFRSTYETLSSKFHNSDPIARFWAQAENAAHDWQGYARHLTSGRSSCAMRC